MIGLRPIRSPDRLVLHAGRFSSGLLAVVVLVLVAFNLWTTGAIRAATERAQVSWTASDTLDQAKFAVSEEESFERKYRLEPWPEWRTKHAEAAALLVSSLGSVLAMHAADGGSVLGNESSIRAALATHVGYLDALRRMFDAVDAGNTALVDQIDSGEVDPALTAVVNAVDGEASLSDLGHDAQGTAIAQSIIALARTLRVGVTAEGVETGVQEAILRRLGCDLAQGYLFGHPLPASEAGLMQVGETETRVLIA